MQSSTMTIAPTPKAQPAPDLLFQLGTGFWGSKVFLSAIELDLFSHLARGPQDFEALSRHLRLHKRSAHDFLDTLVALKVLDRDGDTYANTPEADLYLDRAKPSYIGGIFEMMNARLYGFWGNLTEALRTGEPQNEARRGENFFARLYEDPDRLRQFLSAMSGLSIPAARAMAAEFPWDKHKIVFDIGCAQGAVPAEIALAHPHLTGGGFDLPAVGPIFSEYTTSRGLKPRLSFVAGDMFKDPWPKADVFILGHILHDWSLEQKRDLLARAYAALPPGGAVIVYEALIDDDRRENAFGLLMSLNMLIETPDGFDYTGADCQRWMRDAGFRTTRVQHLAGPDSMVIGIK